MPDAADRIRAEPKADPRARPGWARVRPPKKPSTIAAAALAAMMIGIVVNALALQHGRRIILGPAPTAISAVAPVAPAPAVSPAPAAVPAPPRPEPTHAALAHGQKPADAIADFLRAQRGDKRQQTRAAQTALAKIGFAVKATGELNANTRSALIKFEKSRHMAVSTEITGKLVRSLKAAAAAN